MEDIDIVKQLLNGNHLSESELKEAIKLIQHLDLALNMRLEN